MAFPDFRDPRNDRERAESNVTPTPQERRRAAETLDRLSKELGHGDWRNLPDGPRHTEDQRERWLAFGYQGGLQSLAASQSLVAVLEKAANRARERSQPANVPASPTTDIENQEEEA